MKTKRGDEGRNLPTGGGKGREGKEREEREGHYCAHGRGNGEGDERRNAMEGECHIAPNSLSAATNC